MTELRARHLVPAVLVAAALHAVAAILIFGDAPAPGAAGAGRGGLEVGMGLAGGAPGRTGVEATAPVRPDAVPPATTQPADPSAIAAAAPPDPPPGEAGRMDVAAAEAVPARPDRTPEPAARPAPPVAPGAEPAAARAPAVEAQPAARQSRAPATEMAEPAPTVAAAPEAGVGPAPAREVTPGPPEAAEPADARRARAVETETRGTARTPPRRADAPATRAVQAERVASVEPDRPDRNAAAPSVAPAPQTRPGRARPHRPRAARAEQAPDGTEAKRRKAAGPASSDRESDPSDAVSETGSDGRSAQGEATGRGGNAGSGRTASLGGDPGARRDYTARIAAIIAREKRYPRRARLRRAEGTGHLRFTLDASGRVTAQSIARSTGHSSLDEEIAALLGRAAPLPPIPPEVGRDTLEIVVPIRFRLR